MSTMIEFPALEMKVAQDHPLFVVAEMAVRKFESLAEQVEQAAARLERDMARLAEQARLARTGGAYSINRLGEVQSNGTQLDVLCGRLGEASEHLMAVRYALRQVPAGVEEM